MSPIEAEPTFGEVAGSALRYWEPRRLLYNAALLAVVGAHIWSGWPETRASLERDPMFLFFLLAVLANVAYCAVYPLDIFVQFSGARGAWPRWRWAVLAVGTAFGAVVAHFFTLGIVRG
jgi:hypothetical protein